jgi:hypothetical protein
MGIENRDYYRQPSSGGGSFEWSSGTALVCKRLIIANIIVFLLQILIKVHEQGETSLTEVERNMLQIAGRRYRR